MCRQREAHKRFVCECDGDQQRLVELTAQCRSLEIRGEEAKQERDVAKVHARSCFIFPFLRLSGAHISAFFS